MTQRLKSAVSRRDFLRHLMFAGIGVSGLLMRPRVAAALPAPLAINGCRVLVRIELLGGCDQYGIWLPLEGNRFGALAARRPHALFASHPGQAIDIGGNHGIGLNPALAPLLPHINQTKLFLDTSNDLVNGQSGSHEDAQNIMSIGGQPRGGQFRGWTATLFDNEPSSHLIGFVGARGLNTGCDPANPRCSSTPPPTIDTFETFRFDGTAFSTNLGGANNSAYVADVIQRLAEAGPVHPSKSIVERKFNAAARGVFPAIADIQTTAGYSTPLSNSYGSSRLSRQLRNIAMKVKELLTTDSNERYIFTLGIGGFDVHRDWSTVTQTLMSDLGSSLATFMSDLKAMGAERNVLVVAGTEFGRQIASNGAGTDHGVGSTTLVMGGAVNGGSNAVYGDILTAAEFGTLESAPARIDNRAIIATILDRFLDIDYRKAFPEEVTGPLAMGSYDLFLDA